MSESFTNESSSVVSLLIEHPHGTFEVLLRRVQIDDGTAFVPVQMLPVSGSRHGVPTHSCLGNALSMQKWMDEHMDVFAEGLTSFV